MGAGPWPGTCVGAVSLTFDDGMRSQLEVAAPMLERHGLRGTFYLNPRGDAWETRLSPWRSVADRGHELGNHTCGHPCSRAFSADAAARGLEDMTLDDIAADMDLAQERLRVISGQERRSFAYPCYQAHVGAGKNRRSYVPLVAERFSAGRNKGERPNHPATADLAYVWSFPVERFSGAELVGLCERAAAEGRWSVLCMHGVHEGHLSIADVDLKELCGHLERHRDRLWTAPVTDVATAIAAWRREAGIQVPG